MYEKLTSFIAVLKEDECGHWNFEDEGYKGRNEDNQLPFVIYSVYMHRMFDCITDFVSEHSEMGLNHYYDILEEHGIEWDMESMTGADVSEMDGKTVMALLVGAMRADRFCEGAFLAFIENGCIMKWLKRLREIEQK